MHIIYVNGKYRGNDPIGWLMHDFNCTNASDMKNEFLAEKFRYIKENEKGVKNMCRIMEEFAKEEREEKAIENAVTLVKDYNETPKVAAKKMGAPLDKLLEALKQSTDK